MGTWRIRVTVCICNVPVNLPEVVASLSAYSRVEEMAQLHATAGTAHGDYASSCVSTRKASKPLGHAILPRYSNDGGGGRQTVALLELQADWPPCKSLPSK